MNRIQKRFFEKIAKPFFVTLTVLGTAIVTHFVAAFWGYTLLHVLEYTLLYVLVPLSMLAVAVLFFAPFVIVFSEALYDKWQEAEREIEKENKQLMKKIQIKEFPK